MKVAIVGGGVVGLFSGIYLRKLFPELKVVLLEGSDELGGLLKSSTYGDFRLDYGTHLLSETGDAVVDRLLFDDLDDDAWSVLSGSRRDLSGYFLGDELEERTPFLPTNCKFESFPKPSDTGVEGNLLEVLVARYGRKVVSECFQIPLENLFKCPLDDLSAFAYRLLPLARILGERDLNVWIEKSTDPAYREIFACPNQKLLPAKFQSNLRAFYPKKVGIYQFIDLLAQRFCDLGGEIRLGVGLRGWESSGSAVNLDMRCGKFDQVELVDKVVWAAPTFGLMPLVGGGGNAARPDRTWDTVVVDFEIQGESRLSNYYYIDYGDNDCFRLTNYSIFCEELERRDQGRIMSYEVWDREGRSDEQLQMLVKNRLREISVISGEDDFTPIGVRRVKQGFPMPSVKNAEMTEDVSRFVSSEVPDFVCNVGQFSEKNLFFTADLLVNARKKIDCYFL